MVVSMSVASIALGYRSSIAEKRLCFPGESAQCIVMEAGQYALKKNSIRHFLARWPIKRMQHGETYRHCVNVLILRKRHMHRFSSSTPPRESARHERATEALAQQSHVPNRLSHHPHDPVGPRDSASTPSSSTHLCGP